MTAPMTAPMTGTDGSGIALEGRAGEAGDSLGLIDGELLDGLLERVNAGELQLTGPGGFLSGLIRQVLERGLEIELGDHVGYERGDPAGRGSSNKRNGATPKTVHTEVGPVPLDVPRDRNSTFEPRLVPKGVRRVSGGLDDMIISLYAGGMTVELVKSSVCGVLLVDVGGCSELGLFGSVTQACCERVGPGGDADRVVGLAEG